MLGQLRNQVFLFIGDVLIILAASFLAILLRFGTPVRPSDVPLSGILLSLGLFVGAMYVFNLYDLRTLKTPQAVLSRQIAAFILGAVATTAVFYAFPLHRYGRGVFALQLAAATVGTLAWRLAYIRLLPVAQRTRRLLILGSGPAAQRIIKALAEQPLPFQVVGLLAEDQVQAEAPVLGRPEEAVRLAKEHGAEAVVLATEGPLGPGLTTQLLDLKLQGIECLEMPAFYERLTRRLPAEHIRDEWLLTAAGFQLVSSQMTQRLKRLTDLVIGGLLLAALSPLSLVIALLIKLDSPGPVFYAQTRTGLGEKPFRLIKFRSMTKEAESQGPRWASQNDERVTRLGRWLRAYRLDEIPQLINVLSGEMSLVGPRPERPEFVAQLKESIPYYGLRHLVNVED